MCRTTSRCRARGWRRAAAAAASRRPRRLRTRRRRGALGLNEVDSHYSFLLVRHISKNYSTEHYKFYALGFEKRSKIEQPVCPP